MNLQPQINIHPPITKIEPRPIKIELRFMEFINSLDQLKNILTLQVLVRLSVRQLQQNQVFHFKHKHQELTEQLKKEVSIKITFTINCFSLGTKGFKVMRSL